MTPAAVAILSEHRKHLPTVPCLRDLVPAHAEMTIEEALLSIRKARAAIFIGGTELSPAGITELSREIREVCEELDNVRRILMADPEEL